MKRFYETDRWKAPSFRRLTAPQKLIMFYLEGNCNNAGFIEWDEETCEFLTQIKREHIKPAFEGLARGLQGANPLIVFPEKKAGESLWIFLPEFLKDQKNFPLNPVNNAHKQIISILESMKPLFPSAISCFLAPNQGLISPIGKGKGKGKGKEGESDRVKLDPILEELPENRRKIFMEWLQYKREKGQTYKPTGFKNLVSEWKDVSDEDLLKAIKSSSSKNYDGLFLPSGSNSGKRSVEPMKEMTDEDCTI